MCEDYRDSLAEFWLLQFISFYPLLLRIMSRKKSQPRFGLNVWRLGISAVIILDFFLAIIY